MSDKEYDVGYGKPPKEHRFKPGSSGNPNGRPKGAKNIMTLVKDLTSEKVIISEGGKRRRVSKLEAAVMALIQRAMKGDGRALTLLIATLQHAEANTAQSGSTNQTAAAQDTEILADYLRRAQGDPSGEGSQ